MGDSYDLTWDRWDEVDALLEKVLEVPSEEQEHFLAAACGDDRELLDAVSALLRASEQVPGQLLTPSKDLLKAALTDPSDDDGPDVIEAGSMVGRYRVLEQIGRGGMATVYEAERADGAFTRRVALKVLRRGLDTDDLVRRFLAERQILSSLAHPNIATLLDGGATSDGRPFLAMELVHGRRIDEWAEGAHLTSADRVRLFLQVVDAVTFAHGRLVIHRDLKPANVLVSDEGQVKLLDFGIAKLLQPADGQDAPLTRLAPAPMTPEFASPEQLRGDLVTVASDVYQLGALLYCLLTGDRAALWSEGKATTEPERDLTRPSEVVATPARARALRGDLDTITLKALEPDPALRYGSSAEFAADLRRHLEGQPIHARPASVSVRVRKFSRRNPWFGPVAAVLVLGLGIYVATVQRYSGRLELERNEALDQAQRAEAMRNFMVNQFGAADPYSDEPVNPNVTVVDAMALGAQTARRELADQPRLHADMLSAIAEVYSNLSLEQEARVLLDEAIAIRRAEGADGSPEQLADLGLLGLLIGELGQRDSARVLLIKRLDLERAAFGDEHPRTADALERMGWHWFVDAEYEPALEFYEEAAAIRRATNPVEVGALSSTLAFLADAYRSVGRREEAKRVATEAYEIAREAFGDEHATTAGNQGHLAQVVHGMGDLEEAVSLYRQALPVLERTLGTGHENTLNNWNNLGIVLDEAGDLEGAEEVHQRVLGIRRERYGTEQHRRVATSLQNLGALHVRLERFRTADSLSGLAERIFRAELGADHYSVAFALLTQTEARLQLGLSVEAERAARNAASILDAQFGPGYPTAAARCRLGRALVMQGRRGEAAPLLREALSTLEAAEGVPETEIASCRAALAAP